MKKVLLAIAVFLSVNAATYAQAAPAKKVEPVKKEGKVVPMKPQEKNATPTSKTAPAQKVAPAPKTPPPPPPTVKPTSNTNTTQHLKKDGTPDKRFKESKHLKKDGTPDKRYKENKS